MEVFFTPWVRDSLRFPAQVITCVLITAIGKDIKPHNPNNTNYPIPTRTTIAIQERNAIKEEREILAKYYAGLRVSRWSLLPVQALQYKPGLNPLIHTLSGLYLQSPFPDQLFVLRGMRIDGSISLQYLRKIGAEPIPNLDSISLTPGLYKTWTVGPINLVP